MSKFNDLTGKTFGRLSVVRRLSEDEGAKRGCPKWLCQCVCGNVTHTASTKLVSGLTKSCGCLKTEMLIARSKKHGFAKRGKKSRLYNIWVNMRERCNNPNHPRFKDYGGKGIRVCTSWDCFPSFCAWALENGYGDDLTIDRRNPSKGYTPNNCRWITREENSGRAHAINDERKTIAIAMMLNGFSRRDAADAVGIHISTVIRWAHKLGIMKKGA